VEHWYKTGKAHIWHPYTQAQTAAEPVLVRSTKGSVMTLEDGGILIDGVCSWWSTCHGYNHPYIIQAVEKQLHTMPNVMFAGIAHQPAYWLAERLATLTGMERVFLTDSGSTAVETALKMAVQYWKNKGQKRKDKFVSFSDAYHGDTMGCMSLCDPETGMHHAFHDYMPRQYSVKLPLGEYAFAEFDSLLGDLKSTIAGVILEPLVQGAGGMKFHSADIVAEIYRICHKHEVLFIADEVMTGFGRTGHMFACHEAGIRPDIMCVGKALTGGTMTLAATLATAAVYDAFLGDSTQKALMSGPTFMANPLACAAANASLDLFEQHDRLKQVEAIEKQLYEQLAPCESWPRVKEVRVKGAIGVVQLEQVTSEEIKLLRKAFIQKGVWLRPFGDIIYIMPAFTISAKELKILTRAVSDVLKKILR
jgi:adenosylmethionine---8-amino-7-oxononanoate aminotransferase